MKKDYLIFDLDGTLVESIENVVDRIVSIISQNYPNLEKKSKTILMEYQGTPLIYQMQWIFGDDNLAKYYTDKSYDEIISMWKEVNFFPGIPEKIRELSRNYTLFLTTGNHTKFAKKVLDKGNILECFDMIIGSESLMKGKEHLEKFKDYMGDESFFEKSLYIGDGNSDRDYANSFGIDFVHIGNQGVDKYEIYSVTEIDNILCAF